MTENKFNDKRQMEDTALAVTGNEIFQNENQEKVTDGITLRIPER